MVARRLRFVAPRTVSVERREVPTPGSGEALVASERSLVSPGTELLIYRGEAPTELEADATIEALSGDLSFPLTYGYANVGTVTEVGPDVDDAWLDRSVFAFHPHESHFIAPTDALFPVPEGVDTETATFMPIVETAVNLVLDGAPRLGERVVVFGAGLVGLATISTLSAFPLAELTVVEPIPARRSLATELGADQVVSPAEIDDADIGGADLLFEVSGSPEALDDAVALCGYDGRVVVGSWYGRKRADVDLGGHFHRERVSLVSSQVSTISPELRGRWDTDRRMAVAWRRLRALPVESLVTHRLPVEEAGRGYELLDDRPEDTLGVLLTYEQPREF